MANLDALHPYVKHLCLVLIEECKKHNIWIVVTSTFRSFEEQNYLYAQGRTRPGPIVTNARGGDSFHNYGLAFDIAILNKDGRTINWNDNCDTNHDGKKDYYQVGLIGKSLGLVWGGDFQSITDLPHFQWSAGLSLADLKAGKRPPLNPMHR